MGILLKCSHQWTVSPIVCDHLHKSSRAQIVNVNPFLPLSEAVTQTGVGFTPLSCPKTDRNWLVCFFFSVSYIRSSSLQNRKFKRAAQCFDCSPFTCLLASDGLLELFYRPASFSFLHFPPFFPLLSLCSRTLSTSNLLFHRYPVNQFFLSPPPPPPSNSLVCLGLLVACWVNVLRPCPCFHCHQHACVLITLWYVYACVFWWVLVRVCNVVSRALACLSVVHLG